MSTHLFGIRHHGPGCARSLRLALEALNPDIVLIEGPPDAQEVLPLMRHKAMTPPVALLIYAPDTPSKAVYYPFARFSPEWQALDHAFRRKLPVRFIDLPQEVQLAREPEEPEQPEEAPAEPMGGDEAMTSAAAPEAPADEQEQTPASPREDPLALLAQAAGYDDHELWWERQIEQRRDMVGFFDGILEAMTALRADTTPRDEEEAQREAQMRQGIRAAQQEGFKRIAVVTGAWHSPALGDLSDAKGDAALLKGLKRIKTQATWIPWTNSRLAYRSGYGAGVTSPGWYEHLWTTGDGAPTRWLTRAAHLLRSEGLDASSASVIEAVRLGEALAAMRDLPMPGLAEMHEATQTVLCNGDATRMTLIREKLEIGEAMGKVPPETPAVPLQRDLETQQRRLRFPATTEDKQYDFDLRNENDRARSQLLHRLRLLGIPWGEPQRGRRGMGTFHEYWQVKWQVEFVIGLIEANVWGNTVARAATARSIAAADKSEDLPALTELLDQVILAGLSEAIERVLTRVRDQAAVSSDVRHLMDALPPLARVARYSDVRGAKAEDVLPVYAALFERALIGLPGACASLDDEAAAAMVGSMNSVDASVRLLDNASQREEWIATLRGLVERESIHGLVRGRSARFLLDLGALDEPELQRLARLALSTVTPAPQAGAWVEGVLQGGGLALLHQDGLWQALDGWLSELAPEEFIALLPLLRRSFSGFQPPERRQMGEKVKKLRAPGGQAESGDGDIAPINRERADLVLPVLAQILGGGDA
ncbi:MAG TPA: DUF5682 family protein [Ktedonobacterales bacterium]|jgi:hypothetical protein